MYLTVIAVLLFSYVPARAQLTFTDDETAFLAVNPNLVLQNFESSKVLPMQDIDCPSPANSNSNNDCFSPGDILPGISFFNGPVSDPVEGLLLLGANVIDPGLPPGPVLVGRFFADDFEIVFDPGVSRVGLKLGCATMGPCDTDVQVFVFNKNNFFIGETTVHVTDSFDTFLGISSQELISNISLRNPDLNTVSLKGALSIWFGNPERNIPTLSEWGMIAAAAGLGLVGVFFVVRKRKAQAV